jgi:hypothetical protein
LVEEKCASCAVRLLYRVRNKWPQVCATFLGSQRLSSNLVIRSPQMPPRLAHGLKRKSGQ